MNKLAIDIICEIKEYIENYNEDYFSWYCGITKNTEKRLFGDHKVSKENGRFRFW
ncbi:MAG: hypothetical protein JW866_08205 [Ignavibacteriales bacterium]|nr:hypothetical protein [Ignavibacteriales bacterium]